MTLLFSTLLLDRTLNIRQRFPRFAGLRWLVVSTFKSHPGAFCLTASRSTLKGSKLGLSEFPAKPTI